MRETAPNSATVIQDSTPANQQRRSTITRIALLVVGDALSFLVFATVGRDTHSEAAGITALGRTIWTAFPFALGWFIVSPWLGAFARKHTGTVGKMLFRTEIAWVCAWPVALVLRFWLSADHKMPLSFAIVILLANALFLGLWRSTFAYITRTKS
ncbi:MAG: hypothetical protein OJF49_000172 [Ktedonobacterales bacterium]|jgi:FtsH-binding integral membrane protein|nr:MAG: hypothetical protein OJF49_000172 [Ktedonobacterales bacterium]